MGTIDCLTTMVGVLYFGAVELNPFMSNIVHSSIFGFMVLKLTATLCIAGTYILAKTILNKTADKTTKSFYIGKAFVKVSYASIIVFLIVVVTNNLIILLQ